MVDFSKHLQKAEEAMRRRNFDFAAELYRQLVDLDPNLGEARGGLRRAHQARVAQKKGGAFLRTLGGAVPLASARALARMGKFDACARALEDYLAKKPGDVEANLLLGQCLEECGHFDAARAVYEFLAEVAPRDPAGLKRAGAMLAVQGDPVAALAYYERALEADPRDQEALKARKNLAAETAITSTGLEGAAHSREKIVDKGLARDLEQRQKLHRSDDDLRAELERLEERFAESPSDPALMVEMAELHLKLKDAEAARELAERAATYRTAAADVLDAAGDLALRAGKRLVAQAGKEGDEARAEALERELRDFEVAECRRRLELRPADGPTRLRLGKCLMRSGDLDGALAELQRCQGDPRLRQEAVFLLAQCFHRKGVLELAKKEYQAALDDIAPEGSRLDERAKEILYNLGAIAEMEEDRAGARSFYLRIYEVDVAFRDVADKVGQLN